MIGADPANKAYMDANNAYTDANNAYMAEKAARIRLSETVSRDKNKDPLFPESASWKQFKESKDHEKVL